MGRNIKPNTYMLNRPDYIKAYNKLNNYKGRIKACKKNYLRCQDPAKKHAILIDIKYFDGIVLQAEKELEQARIKYNIVKRVKPIKTRHLQQFQQPEPQQAEYCLDDLLICNE